METFDIAYEHYKLVNDMRKCGMYEGIATHALSNEQLKERLKPYTIEAFEV